MKSRLVQFQCAAEGSLFYYQHTPQGARNVITQCPVCGSGRVRTTGREFGAVDENAPLPRLAEVTR
jgi:hypothetical protein